MCSVTQLCTTLCDPMGLSWQEYWSGLPFPSPGALPLSGIEPTFCSSYIGRQILCHQAICDAPSYIAGGMQSCMTPVRVDMIISSKIIYALLFDQAILLLKSIKIHWQKKTKWLMHKVIYCSTICNRKDWKQPNNSSIEDWWINIDAVTWRTTR